MRIAILRKDGSPDFNADGTPRISKLPVNIHTLRGASTTDPDTWASFDEAAAAIGKKASVGKNSGIVEGVGFVFAPSQNTDHVVTGIDLDHVIDPKSGAVNPLALDLIQSFDSYVELSPSGTGVHIFFYGKLHPEWRHKIENAFGDGTAFEIYQTGRFFTMTGDNFTQKLNLTWCDDPADTWVRALTAAADSRKAFPPAPANTDTLAHAPNPAPAANPAYAANAPALSDDEVISKASSAKNGILFQNLFAGNWQSSYGSQSEADMALCSMLAFWTCRNEAQMDSLFRRSGLYREKWDEKRGCQTYGQMTVQKAAASCREVYHPQRFSSQPIQPVSNNNNEISITAPLPVSYEKILQFRCDAIGAANLFAESIKHFVCYISDLKVFSVYNGKNWQDDTSESLRVGKMAMTFIHDCQAAIPNKDDTSVQAYRKLFRSMAGAALRGNLINDVKKLLAVNSDLFDKDDFLLNVQNGTIDLQSGKLREHSPLDFCRKIANVDYDPAAVYPRFIQFINEITENDLDRADALQKSLGYSLSGSACEECFFIAYGRSTRNGKGALFSSVENLLGTYCATTEFDAFSRIRSKDGSRANPEIARLQGKRFILCNEPDKGSYFNESLLKQLTGGDTIAARGLYSDFIEFKPQFKLFVTANSLPNVRDNSLFASGRIKILNFPHHFSEEQQDKTLKEKLTSNEAKSAILNWLIDGYNKYKKEGLPAEGEGNRLVADYCNDNDLVSQYIAERLIIPVNKDAQPRTKLTTVRNNYVSWCADCGVMPMSRKMLKEELISRNVPVYSYGGQVVVRAIIKT